MRIVRQVWGAVEEVADAMPAVGSHNLEALSAYMVADDISHLPIPHPWLDCINRLLQRLQHAFDIHGMAQMLPAAPCLHLIIGLYSEVLMLATNQTRQPAGSD